MRRILTEIMVLMMCIILLSACGQKVEPTPENNETHFSDIDLSTSNGVMITLFEEEERSYWCVSMGPQEQEIAPFTDEDYSELAALKIPVVYYCWGESIADTDAEKMLRNLPETEELHLAITKGDISLICGSGIQKLHITNGTDVSTFKPMDTLRELSISNVKNIHWDQISECGALEFVRVSGEFVVDADVIRELSKCDSLTKLALHVPMEYWDEEELNATLASAEGYCELESASDAGKWLTELIDKAALKEFFAPGDRVIILQPQW